MADEQKKASFLSELFAPVGGFGVTFATMFRKLETEEYPEVKRPPRPRSWAGCPDRAGPRAGTRSTAGGERHYEHRPGPVLIRYPAWFTGTSAYLLLFAPSALRRRTSIRHRPSLDATQLGVTETGLIGAKPRGEQHRLSIEVQYCWPQVPRGMSRMTGAASSDASSAMTSTP